MTTTTKKIEDRWEVGASPMPRKLSSLFNNFNLAQRPLQTTAYSDFNLIPTMSRLSVFCSLALSCLFLTTSLAFTFQVAPGAPASAITNSRSRTPVHLSPAFVDSESRHQRASTRLYMSSLEKTKTTKKGTLVKDRTETKPEGQKKKEEMWRVLLHNDEVHTFNYVIRSLCKVIGTLDRKAAFEICVQTHGIGKATVTKTWKKQAEQFCLGLQRQGLTVSISPDEDFEGGHSGGGL